MSNKLLLKLSGLVLYIVLALGVVGPWLISQPSNITFVGGILLVIVVPIYFINREYIKLTKRIKSKNEKTS